MAELQARPTSTARPSTATATARVPSQEELEAERAALLAARSMLSTGEVLKAQEVLEPFERLAVEAASLLILARLRATQGQFDAAMKLLDRAESADPADVKVAFHKAELLDYLGRHREAVPIRRRVAYQTRTPSAKALVDLLRSMAKGVTASEKAPTAELRMVIEQLRSAPDRDLAQFQRACQLLYEIEPFRDAAQQLYREADPCPADKLNSDAAWISLQAWAGVRAVEFRSIPDAGRPGRRPQAAKASQVFVSSALDRVPIVDRGTKAISGLTHHELPLQSGESTSPLLLNSLRSCYVRLPRQCRREPSPSILIGGSASYGDNLIDHVGSLAVVEHFGWAEGRKLVLSPSIAREQAELLELLGYAQPCWVRLASEEVVEFDDLVIASPLALGRQWIDPFLVAWYRSRLAQRAPSEAWLYVSRRHASAKRIENEAEVEAALSKRGFDIVHPELLTVKEQVARFSGASVVVGADCDALANMVFAQQGMRLFVLADRGLGDASQLFAFEGLATACGHHRSRVDCVAARIPSGISRADADLRVDVGELLAALPH